MLLSRFTYLVQNKNKPLLHFDAWPRRYTAHCSHLKETYKGDSSLPKGSSLLILIFARLKEIFSEQLFFLYTDFGPYLSKYKNCVNSLISE